MDRREKTGRDREISSGAADRAFYFSVRAFQTIKGNRTDDE
jgi:hypothetical protein